MGSPYGKAMSEWRGHLRKPLCEYCGSEDMGKQHCPSCGAPGKVHASYQNYKNEMLRLKQDAQNLAT